MEEKIDVLNKEGQKTGEAVDKSEIFGGVARLGTPATRNETSIAGVRSDRTPSL